MANALLWLLCAGWEVSAVTDMSYMTLANGADISSTSYFSVDDDAKAFNANLNTWDTSSVTDMEGAFYQAKKFNSAIGEWDVSKVKTMARMFYNANGFNSAIGAWDTSKVKDMSNMFYSAYGFNDPTIVVWDVSSVTNFFFMFGSAFAFNVDVSPWDID